jgi:hypothetical protein
MLSCLNLLQDPDFELEWLPGLASRFAPSQPSQPAAPEPAAAPQQQHQQQQQQAEPAGSRAAAGRASQWAQGRRLNLAVLQALVRLKRQPLFPAPCLGTNDHANQQWVVDRGQHRHQGGQCIPCSTPCQLPDSKTADLRLYDPPCSLSPLWQVTFPECTNHPCTQSCPWACWPCITPCCHCHSTAASVCMFCFCLFCISCRS